jgi:ankyrin repeat protein
MAIKQRAPDQLLAALAAGADPNLFKKRVGPSILMDLCSSVEPADLNALQILLRSGADPDQLSREGAFAAMFASANSNRIALAMLAQAGADLGLKDAAGHGIECYASAARSDNTFNPWLESFMLSWSERRMLVELLPIQPDRLGSHTKPL